MWFADVYDPLLAGALDGSAGAPHDAAIQRAQCSHYKPPKHVSTDPLKTLYVGRLNFDTTEASLEQHFKLYGDIVSVTIIRNLGKSFTGCSEGYGFVTFERTRSAEKAYSQANHSVLDNHMILVDYERARVMSGWIPRRLGGGIGGRKESGQLRFGGRDKPFRWPIRRDTVEIRPEQRRDDTVFLKYVSETHEPRSQPSA
ncbi:hypothetical protein BCR43DRAFT_520689 [Syncephalastrum racemosum]|uniref:RRM domain-containing protein n=1 Tax=Syncephalastrum racemosum TaxID=13706 RepID=A0A1X2HVH9_SYNRA|nr:hypothetical protein BCR43DRAFT_520689 [Syncephalastrum racemosum]